LLEEILRLRDTRDELGRKQFLLMLDVPKPFPFTD
jgi:hypothetical protein